MAGALAALGLRWAIPLAWGSVRSPSMARMQSVGLSIGRLRIEVFIGDVRGWVGWEFERVASEIDEKLYWFFGPLTVIWTRTLGEAARS